MSGQGGKDWRVIINALAFVSVMLIGIALILVKIFGGGQVSTVIANVANALAYIITAISGFFFVKNKKQVWIWVAYLVGVVMIIIGFILTLFS